MFMISHFDKSFEKYVQLGVRVGVNLQQNQILVIQAPTAAMDLVRMATKVAYEAGAKHVHVEWLDDEISRIRYETAPLDSFEIGAKLRARTYEELVERGAAVLSFVSSNPDLLQGIDPDKVASAAKLTGSAMVSFRDAIRSDKISWSILAVPTPIWAAKVYPDLAGEQQMSTLWDAIFHATRVDEHDPVKAWDRHLENLGKRIDMLNAAHYRALHYTAPGTDLTVELANAHLWVAGNSVNEKGIKFVANMPTEEVFTAPKRDGVNGIVRSTKPLNYSGTLIEDFSLTFKHGKIVDVSAKQGLETLQRLIAQDEGASYLGEVALVPHQSPISEMGIIFYNTLFDENASNHLAIGSAYSFCIEGGKTMSKPQLKEQGLNDSIVHVDFMIGSDQMNIDGIKADGSREPIFRNGNWAMGER
jgi:aminopeptidase